MQSSPHFQYARPSIKLPASRQTFGQSHDFERYTWLNDGQNSMVMVIIPNKIATFKNFHHENIPLDPSREFVPTNTSETAWKLVKSILALSKVSGSSVEVPSTNSPINHRHYRPTKTKQNNTFISTFQHLQIYSSSSHHPN